MDRHITPVLEAHEAQTHHPIPTRVKIQGAIEFCEAMNILYFKNDVFRVFGVKKRAGWDMLGDSSRTRHNADVLEIRGRHGVIFSQQIREMERVLETEGMKARGLTWEQLGYEVRLECSDRTIQRAMRTMNYHKCVACRKGWVSESTVKRRVEWTTVMKEKYPDKKD